MRKYLNTGSCRYQLNKALFAVREKELIEYVSGKINTREKRICVAHPEGSGKSELLNLLSAYYEDGALDYLFDFKDEHFGKYDVVRINLREILEKNPIDSWPVEMMYYELKDEIKREYRRIRFEKDDELSDILRKIYAVTKRQFMVFIDDYDLPALNGRRYDRNTEHYSRYIPELVPDKNDEHIALVYITGVLPVESGFTRNCLKNFRQYSIYNPGILTDVLRKDTHSSDVAHIKYLINRNRQLVERYIVPLISGVKVSVNLDKYLYQAAGERSALVTLSYMGAVKYLNHILFLEDEKMRIYLLNSIYHKDLDKYLTVKNVFEEEYSVIEKKDKAEIIDDVLLHNFSLAYKYKLPEISEDESCTVITYYPRDEYKNTEKIRMVCLGNEIIDDGTDAQKVLIKI